jgi:hypothetical protein
MKRGSIDDLANHWMELHLSDAPPGWR